MGGPIKKDKLWFFVAPAQLGCGAHPGRRLLEQDAEPVPDAARRRLQRREVDAMGRSAGRPDERPPASGTTRSLSRVTWQATAKNKFNVTYDEQRALQLRIGEREPSRRSITCRRIGSSRTASSRRPGAHR